MGLEAFSTESKSSTSKQTTKDETSSNVSSKYFKHIDNGKRTLAEGHKELVFQTERQWNETINIISDEMGLDEDAIMELPREEQYEVLRAGRLAVGNGANVNLGLIEKCFICGERFKFGENWDFVEFKGETVCPDHEIRTVNQEYLKLLDEMTEEGADDGS